MQKNHLLKLFATITSCLLLISVCLNAQTGTWTKVTTPAPHANMGICLLMTDGTVICHNTSGGGDGTGWDRLTPDIHGSYVNGTWSSIASMNNDRLFFSSQVLPSGKVYVAGGEYGAGGTNGEVYDPVADTWTLCGPPPANWNIYDGNSELLYNDNVLEGPQIGATPSFDCLFWSPVTNQYTSAPSSLYNHDEAAWLKLPDSSVLFVGIANDSSNRYIPQTNTWVNDSIVPGYLYDGLEEAGGAFMLPNGKAIFFGATPFNAIYTPSGNSGPGSWAVADSFPVINGCPVTQSDAPSAMMVNGHILLSVSPDNACAGQFSAPCYFLEYDYTTNTFTRVTNTLPGVGGDSIPVASYQTQMLDLPSGQVLLSVSQATSSYSTSYFIYTPAGAPIPQGKPTINNITPVTCNNYMITGKLFNGISEGASYGDDWQAATNYPIIRLTHGTDVYYAKTYNWNRIGAVQTDSLEDTAYFTVSSIPAGADSLVVVVNGFASNPVPFKVFGVSITSQTNVSCSGLGSAVAFANYGITPYTYMWSPTGGTTDSASGLSGGTYTITVTDSTGCPVTASVTIAQPPALNIYAYPDTGITCNGDKNGSAYVYATGGTTPYTYSWSNGQTTNIITGLSSGTYTVTVSDSCGSSGTASVNITQPAALTATSGVIYTSSSSTCDGMAWVTSAGGTPPYIYSWSPGGGTTDTIKNLCNSNYCCTITDNNGCTQTACVDIVTGIEQLQSMNYKLQIEPNPNNGVFQLRIKNYELRDKGEVEIYNMLGQLVFQAQYSVPTTQYKIDLSGQPAGVYLCRVITDKGKLLGDGKFVIER